MKITITAEDIDGATRRDTTSCPVARALRRTGLNRPAAHAHRATFGPYPIYDHRRNVMLYSPELVEQVLAFDNGKEFVAGEYDLRWVGVDGR